MKLAAKLILLFLVGLLLIVGVFSYITVRRERQLAMEDHQRYAAAMAEILRDSRSNEAAQLSSESHRVRIRSFQISRFATDNGGVILSEEIKTIIAPDERGVDTFYTYIPNQQQQAGEAEDSPAQNGGIEISAPDAEASARTRRAIMSSVITLLSVSGLSAFVILVGGIKMVGRPLNQLIDKVNRVSAGDFSDPVAIRSSDELGQLGHAINQMCLNLQLQREKIETETASRIAATEQLRHADRLQSVGRMAAGIAHEIGTPLNVVSGRAELIASGELSDQANQESAIAIKHESDRITKIISGLLDFSRQRPPERRPTDMSQVVQSTVDLMRPMAEKADATLIFERPDVPLVAEVDPTQVQQVATNLINNAIQSSTEGVRVQIDLKQDDSNIVFIVSDDGQGIDRESREHLFEPFYTTKDVGKGTGLGLAVAHGIVSEHGGSISVQSEPGRGACFTVTLPRIADENQSPRTDINSTSHPDE